MGQYYIPVIMRRTRTKHMNVRCVYAHEYGNGHKLMEHSFVGNKFVNIVFNELVNNPASVIWLGDYAEPGDVPNMENDQFQNLYNTVWKSDTKGNLFIHKEDALKEFNFDEENYLINHTKRVFIDLKSYKKEAPNASRYFDDKTELRKINPLPLLTVCSNGRGNGDYYPAHAYEAGVGEWVNDILEVKWDKPKGYKEVQYFFRENC